MFTYEEHEVTYDGDRTIFYLAAGIKSGPLIIFMHGWPSIGKLWYPQLESFASLGFRVIAPDMPGYGGSTARATLSDYSQENIVNGMLAVLADTGCDQAIWVAHDWGCGTLWTLANTQPQVCRAVVGMCVPFATIELGLEELLETIDRDLYPKDQYPYGQWSYQVFYEQSFDKATEWFNKNLRSVLKLFFSRSNTREDGKPAFTANVVKDGGWLGGIESLPPPEHIPDAGLIIDPEVFKEFVAAMEKTGFGPGDAWYMNHMANRAYNLANTKNGLKLDMPVFFINAKHDTICNTVTGRLAEKMRSRCSNLKETTIYTGHFVAAEKPEETNSAIAQWLVTEVPDWWPKPTEV